METDALADSLLLLFCVSLRCHATSTADIDVVSFLLTCFLVLLLQFVCD